MDVWYKNPLVNIVYESIKKLSREGEIPVGEEELLAFLRRARIEVSAQDLSKILMTLERLGYIHVFLSTKEDRLIRFVKGND
ncbi:MAG: hypothetical protein F7C07_00835 [Desulfurococcales archaeon]|nr:hypothetical protein [Desulfurococcales archaeon]